MIVALFQLSLNTTTSPSSLSLNALTLQPPQNTPSPLPPIFEPRLAALLHRYSTLFSTPTSLPPSRHNDYSITLLPNTTPISVRPYRYPHFQKQEIEVQVQKMLESGFIKPSTSPYSSPVLLVKKKDET
uniref:Retrovirus-related Pol polyprotein from transposon 412 family n=1 Tax=Cajanus cajan TaxID=3821 RepID=A0A151RDQ8_CAJCA|nr:Retrovirus-related Pol polyprotein from transposon 412 family [Cajanus cajan]